MIITKNWLIENDVFNDCEYYDGESLVDWFLAQHETDAAKVMLKLIECNRPSYSTWLMKKLIKNKRQSVLIAVFSAEHVIHIFEKKYPENKSPRWVISEAKAWIDNPCEETKQGAANISHSLDSTANAALKGVQAARLALPPMLRRSENPPPASVAAYDAEAALAAYDAAFIAIAAIDLAWKIIGGSTKQAGQAAWAVSHAHSAIDDAWREAYICTQAAECAEIDARVNAYRSAEAAAGVSNLYGAYQDAIDTAAEADARSTWLAADRSVSAAVEAAIFREAAAKAAAYDAEAVARAYAKETKIKIIKYAIEVLGL